MAPKVFIEDEFDARDKRDKPGKHRRRGRSHKHEDHESTSDDELYVRPSYSGSSETEDESMDVKQVGNGLSKNRLVVQIPSRGHRRTTSAHSAVDVYPVNKHRPKSPYETLWINAEQEFRIKYDDEASKYDAVRRKVAYQKKDNIRRLHSDGFPGFQNTLAQTKVFLNRSRKGKEPRIREKIAKFLTILTQLTSPLSSLSGMDPMIAQPAWTGFCVVLTLCLNLTTKSQELLSDIEIVADIIRLYSALERRYSEVAISDLREVLFTRTARLFLNILRFQAVAAYHLNQHVWQRKAKEAFAFNSWSTFIQDIRDADNDCQQALQQESHRNIMDTITELRVSLQEDIKQLSGRSESVVDWISGRHIDSRHSEVHMKSDLFRDRGAWFLKLVTQWIDNKTSQSVYWLHGIYGMGKTFLISRVIEDIENKNQAQPNRQLAYFYFSEEKGGNTPEVAMRCLLAQLAITPDGSIAPSVETLYNSRSIVQLGLKQCQQEISVLVGAQTQTIIVIDAIDECSEPAKFLRTLNSIILERKNSIKIILSSKEGIKNEITSLFSSHSTTKLDAKTNEDDIKHYIDVHVKKRDLNNLGSRILQLNEACSACAKPRFRGTCADCSNRIETENKLTALLLDKCHGMFTWVELQLGFFFSARSSAMTYKDVEERMRKLRRMVGEPKLDKIYAQIMERNTSGDEAREISQRVYKWLLHSRVQLSMKALTEAVSINADGSKTPNVEISTYCSNLIDINNDQVVFAHPTIRSYLEQVKDKKGIKTYSAIQSHKEIATACLVSLKTSHMPKLRNISKVTEWGVREYAAIFWPSHLREVPDIDEDKTLRDLSNAFFFRNYSRTTFKTWAEYWTSMLQVKNMGSTAAIEDAKIEKAGTFTGFDDICSLIVPMLSAPPDPFFSACVLGLRDVCNKSKYTTKEKSQKRNINDKLGVFLTIESQRLNALQMLIDAKVDVTKAWQEGNNALHWASIYGTVEMIKLLNDNGIDMASKNDQGATASHLAATSKVDPIGKIKYLANIGLGPNVRDPLKATVLHYAAKSPNVSRMMIKKLKELRADFAAQDALNKTGLHYAVQNPDLPVDALEDLLDEVEINVADVAGRTALSYLVESASRDPTKLIQSFLGWEPHLAVPLVLHHAVQNTQISASLVKRLISKDVINDVDERGRTPLHCAIIPCHESSAAIAVLDRTISIIKELVKAGAKCDIADKKGETVLHFAARAPTIPKGLVDLLLSNKANAKTRNHSKETALHLALEHNKSDSKRVVSEFKTLIDATGDLSLVDTADDPFLHRGARNIHIKEEVLKYLLSAGVNVNAKDSAGSTASHYILAKDFSFRIDALLGKGANLDALDGQKSTMLHCAARRTTSAEASKINFLVEKGINVDSRDMSERTPVHIAASFGNSNAVRALLEKHSADAYALDEKDNTLLHFAVLNSEYALDITKYLIKRQVNVNARNKQNETPLHLAAKKGYVEVVRELLRHDADCMARTDAGETALHYAARQDEPSKKIIEKLINADKSIKEAKNNLGETALHLAMRSHTSSVGYSTLLQEGASANAKDNKGVECIDTLSLSGSDNCALHIAASNKWTDATKLLLKHGARKDIRSKEGHTPLCVAAIEDSREILRDLLEAGASPNTKSNGLSTPLHHVVRHGSFECVMLLLSKGARINEQNRRDSTPLGSAMSGDYERLARILLEHGADWKIKNITGQTVLHRAARLGRTSIVRVMLEHGADIEALTDSNNTPLDEAIRSKRWRTIELLLDHGARYSVQGGLRWKGPRAESPEAELTRRNAFVTQLIAERNEA